MNDAYVAAIARRIAAPVKPVALVCAADTAVEWREAVHTLAPQLALIVEDCGAVAVGSERLPRTLGAILRADGWRHAAPPPRQTGSSRESALLLQLGGRAPDQATVARFALGALHATANGRVLGGAVDLVAELARTIPTATIDVWWTRAGEAPVRIRRTIAMMRLPVARINDGAFAKRVAELLLEAARDVLDERVVMIPPDTDDLLSHRARADVERATPALGSFDALRLMRRRVGASVDARLWSRRWCLGYRRTAHERPTESFAAMHQSELLIPPAHAVWADPFPVRAQGVDLLYFEEQASNGAKARLVCAELLGDGRLGPVVPVLEAATHLSYPQLFQWQGEWFMIPESASAGVVALYRAAPFPHRWRHECDLLTGVSLVDATVLHRGGAWWMLATRITADDVALEELHAFTAPDLTGPWVPLSINPVVSDARRGRPGGRFLNEGETLLRPAQDSAVMYGYGLSLQEITAWDATRYNERTLTYRSADWAPSLDGVHTFNRSETLTCIDVARRERRGAR